MGRLLVLVFIVVAIVWLVRRALRAPGGDRGDAVARKPDVQGELVSCARCGVHLPRSEARESGGAVYCSAEHARLGRSG